MRVSITLQNTRPLVPKDWADLIAEVADAIDDHAERIVSIDNLEPGKVCWTAEFTAPNAKIAKAALTAIAFDVDGTDYAWLGVTEAAEVPANG